MTEHDTISIDPDAAFLLANNYSHGFRPLQDRFPGAMIQIRIMC